TMNKSLECRWQRNSSKTVSEIPGALQSQSRHMYSRSTTRWPIIGLEAGFEDSGHSGRWFVRLLAAL
ncbi:hypothetical protein, partial [Caballeronia sp. INML1]|uniref:hypothetical protein n=1 Tax=Caballeronia sp. INML1 TaxID=2921760 RepID=UPI002028082B